MADWKMGGVAGVPIGAIPLPVANGGTGNATGDVSACVATPAGASTARTMAAILADTVNVRSRGAVCDGVTDDGPALAAMITALGATNHTVVIPGNCVTNQALAFPLNLEVRFLNNAVFMGTGAVTYAAPQIHLWDRQGSTASALEIDHYGDTGIAAYGLDIQNYADNGAAPTAGTGARHAIVIHQYSDASGCAALQIDNTRSQPLIILKQSKNETHSAGQHGVGDFFQMWGYSATAVYPANNPVFLGKLDHLMTWRPADTSRPWTYRSDIACPALKIVGATAGYRALEVTQLAAGNSLYLSHQGAANALQIDVTAAIDGFYPIFVNGRNHGAKFMISQDGAGNSALLVQKDGTGDGTGLMIVNKGTGYSLKVSDGTNERYRLTATGMPQIGVGNVAAPPTAAVGYAGMLWYRSNGAGVKDDVLICTKDAADAYAWRVIY